MNWRLGKSDIVKMNQKVSIITVCLNSVNTIEQTIKSVLNQTYPNIEYIIIDGKSVDGTIEVIKKYEGKIGRWISEPDAGLYDAMNKGIAMASGDIIGIINSDDWYAIQAVEKVVQVFEQGEADVVYGKLRRVHVDGQIAEAENGDLNDMPYRMTVPHPTAFVKKSVYSQYGLFNLQYELAADYEFFLRIYLQKVKMKQVDCVLAYFREGGLSGRRAKTCAKELKEISLKYMDGTENDKMEVLIEEYYRLNMERITFMQFQKRLYNMDLAVAKKTLNRHLPRGKEIYVFGAGNVGIEVVGMLLEHDIVVKEIWDNKADKVGSKFGNVPICKPSKANSKEKIIIVAVMKFQDDICSQLEQLGYIKGSSYLLYSDLVL